MGIGVSIFLIAVGAVLAFAVHATSGAVNIHTVGWILMGVGLAAVKADRPRPEPPLRRESRAMERLRQRSGGSRAGRRCI